MSLHVSSRRAGPFHPRCDGACVTQFSAPSLPAHASMASELKTARQGHTLVLTLSDPPTRNTLSEQLVAAGVEALNVAESDDTVRVAILRGRQWAWLAEPVSPRQLHAFGLVNWVTDAGQALEQAAKVADQLAAMAPNALAGAKELLHKANGAGLARHLEAERDQFIENLFHPNAGEGLQAFFEKRPPQFK